MGGVVLLPLKMEVRLIIFSPLDKGFPSGVATVRERVPGPLFYRILGQTHMNGWSRVVASQNGGSTSYIFPFKLRVLQWSRHLFNYWKNKKTIIEKFLILLI